MKHRNVLTSTLALTGSLLAVVAFAQTTSIKKGLKITFIPRAVNIPYEVIADNGGLTAIKEMGGIGKAIGPSDAGPSSQIPYLNTVLAQRPNAIVIAGNDPNALIPSLKRAQAQGIKVVTFDSDVAPEGRQIFINQASSELVGRGEIQLLAKLMNYKGDFAILSTSPTATNQNTWIKFMQDELKKPAYKNMKLVKIAYGNDDDQKSFTEMQGLLQAYPNLKGVTSPTTVGISAGARYLSTSPYKGKVVMSGLGTPNQMRQFIKDGTVTAFQLWNPNDLGYLAAYAAGALASGIITGKEGDTFTAGKLGKYTVGKQGEVILGPPTTFDKSNVDKFNF